MTQTERSLSRLDHRLRRRRARVPHAVFAMVALSIKAPERRVPDAPTAIGGIDDGVRQSTD